MSGFVASGERQGQIMSPMKEPSEHDPHKVHVCGIMLSRTPVTRIIPHHHIVYDDAQPA
jgi:hypothetical protein